MIVQGREKGKGVTESYEGPKTKICVSKPQEEFQGVVSGHWAWAEGLLGLLQGADGPKSRALSGVAIPVGTACSSPTLLSEI